MIESFVSWIPGRGSVTPIPRCFLPASGRHRFLRYAAGFGLASTALFFSASPGARAQMLGDPSVFNPTGAAQTYIVPAGVSLLQVELWGAGGDGLQNAFGGDGGFVGGNLSVTPGQTLTLIVGQGGSQANSGAGSYGGGGLYGGGGRSAIDMLISGVTTEVITAGGGGGGGRNGGVQATVQANGGNWGASGNGYFPGGGATTTAGGAAGNNKSADNLLPATAGTQFQGGSGGLSSHDFGVGGGGGGGYFGGGGGIAGPFSNMPSGGGGGSSYIGSPLLGGSGVIGNLDTDFGNSISDYDMYGQLPTGGQFISNGLLVITGRGAGGRSTGANGPSGSGLIIIRPFTDSAAPEPSSLSLLGGLGLSALPIVAGLRRRRAHGNAA